jgi:AcrR family transcriptional regulator
MAMARARGRRDELVDTAFRLFLERGYDATPVEALLEATRLSKGAFYHHFASKEDVLDAVVAKLTDQGAERLREAVDKAGRSAVAQLRALLRVGPQMWVGEPELMANVIAVFYRPENLRLRIRMQERSVDTYLPILAGILATGSEQREMSVAEPVETARLMLTFGHAVGELQMPALLAWRGNASEIDAVKRRSDVYLQSLERMLGTPPRSLGRIGKNVFRRVAEILRPAEAAGEKKR